VTVTPQPKVAPAGSLAAMTSGDWYAWHDTYDEPDSWQARRLVTVRERIRIALDAPPPGPVTVLALVAGQGRDLLPVLAEHPRRDDVTARLVELDVRNAEVARTAARESGLSGVDVVTGDAALIDNYIGVAPADLVLICGLFPHIADDDIARVVEHTTSLTKRGGTVIWTRHRREPDLVPTVAGWFDDRGFEQLWMSEPDVEHAVGVHRYLGEPRPITAGTRMFTFVGIRVLRPWEFAASS
jgi:hypothetical protein